MTYTDYENDIRLAYEEGVTMEQAERLAAKFLSAQLQVSTELRTVDLDSRMRKSGLKAIKANVYLEAVSKTEKKPTEGTLTALIDGSELVQNTQESFDRAEAQREELQRLFSVFQEAHIYFRNIAKGSFGG